MALFKDKFENSTIKLADFVENKIENEDVEIINIIHKQDKVYFILENISDKRTVKLNFDFTNARMGTIIVKEFEDVFAFGVDFDYFYLEPNRRVGYKNAFLHRFKRIY